MSMRAYWRASIKRYSRIDLISVSDSFLSLINFILNKVYFLYIINIVWSYQVESSVVDFVRLGRNHVLPRPIRTSYGQPSKFLK